MIEIVIICVGKNKEKFFEDAFREYAKRLGAFCNLRVVEIPERRIREAASSREIERALETEAEDIRRHISAGSYTVALCIEGKMSSSPAFSETISTCMVRGVSRLIFIIGGSLGLASSVKAAADCRLSMSPMTFPHHLARVMLAEQIYRAFMIINGSKYHK